LPLKANNNSSCGSSYAALVTTKDGGCASFGFDKHTATIKKISDKHYLLEYELLNSSGSIDCRTSEAKMRINFLCPTTRAGVSLMLIEINNCLFTRASIFVVVVYNKIF
jgi:hypothetical protein